MTSTIELRTTKTRKSADMIGLREIASNLYDGGWRSSDCSELKQEYNFNDYELDIIVDALQDYEQNME